MEKPREKLLQCGASTLSDTELLAIALGCGFSTKKSVALARSLLSDYHSLQALFQADYHTLIQHPGVGMAKYTVIKAIAELHLRCLREPLYQESLFVSSKVVQKYLIAQLRSHTEEIFVCLFLNTQYRLIRFEKLFRGTVSNTTVHPREVLKRALALNASAIIVAHNHPSGNLKASAADKSMTRHLRKTLALVEIKLIDHVIVAGHQTLSFAEHGYL